MTMNKLQKLIENDSTAQAQKWDTARRQSNDYMAALGISYEELEGMVRKNFALATGNYIVFPKHICAIPYGGEWTFTLQARLETSQFHAGGGTTYFTVVDEVTHKIIVDMLKAEDYAVVTKRIWP